MSEGGKPRARWFLVFAGIVLGFGIGVPLMLTMNHGAGDDRRGLNLFGNQASGIAMHLLDKYGARGNYPTTDEGLADLMDAIRQDDALGRRRVVPSGILSYWGDPIIYENSRAWSQGKHVSRDSKHARYSFEVDQGIRLWSVGAKLAEESEAAKQRLYLAISLCSLIACAPLLAAYVLADARRHRDAPRYVQALSTIWAGFFGLVVAVAVSIPVWMVLGTWGCGCVTPVHTRTPELTQAYITQMRTYRDQGAISDSTYGAILRNLELDKKHPNYLRPN